MSKVVDRALSLVGTPARLRSTDARKGLCCYGVVRACLEGVVETLPGIEAVGSSRLSEAVEGLSGALRRASRPALGDIALFRNGGMGRRRLSEAHLGVIVTLNPTTVVHADVAARRVVATQLHDMQNVDLISYWRVS